MYIGGKILRIRKIILYSAAIAVLVAAIAFSVLFVLKLNNEYAPSFASSIESRTYELSGWQFRWGDSPVDADGRFLWMDEDYENSEWTDFEFPGRPPNSENHRSIWIKTVLPDIDMKHASFRFRAPQNTVEVYLEDQLIYSYGTHDTSERARTPGRTWHFADLPDGFSGKTMYVRMSSPFPHLAGYLIYVAIGHRGAHYLEILNMNLSPLLVGSLSVFLGLAIIMIQILSLYRRNSDIYLGLGSVFIGGWLLSECNLFQLIAAAPVAMTYSANFFIFLAPVWLLIYIERNFITKNSAFSKLMKIIALEHAVFTVAAFALDFAGIISVLDSVRVFHILLAASILISICGTIKSIIDGEKSARVLLVGILALGLSGLFDTFTFFYDTSQQQQINIVSQAGMLIFLTVLMINAALRIKQLYKQIELQSKKTETNYKSLFTNMTDGFALNRLEYDEDGRLKNCIICEANDAFTEKIGLSKEELIGSDLLLLIPEIGEICQGLCDAEEEAAATGDSRIINDAVRLMDNWYRLSIFYPQKDYMSIIFSDVTAMKNAEEIIRRQAYTDSMTGFHNRLFFEAEMSRMNAQLSALKPLSIIVIDIDGLKITNDTFGHNAGDELLKKAAAIIRKIFKGCGVISRIGGDEFCILLPRTEQRLAQEKTDYLLRLLNRANSLYPSIPISMSIGIASTEEDENDDIYGVYRRADDDMYKYKISQTSSDKSRVVDMLLAALSEKDYVAQGHVERISRLCQQMADTLDLRESQKRNLLLLSKIHDLGKIGVPDEILNKPGKLTRKEFDRMKSHVSIGFNIASRAKELVSVAPYILHHHEHWDGTGYPDGLRGEEIPLECRILGIIDAFDAMTNDRPYQEGISVEEAVEEIKRGAGKQFDPYLVEKFLEILAAGNRKSDTDVRDNIVRRENADAGNNAINRDNVNS
jgi:diguanylate cyclase (GGDEF)-like protein